ncbi:alpha beta hydrolase fold-3 domain-containing protein [Colletotrichum karsti]|uniref:Alpha beta hydrolase fold-3 domain-containing protein n=1 Tax=Colletotrichum karsti TaxID=1095194 RepID=A0A9P6IAT6_9PEZI|nr:alpha beta hydrolase fold-3 domain-containing protein [Colletotrichum karsti]KAF9880283.1 alpha beta hydrolase fold-3 domain-containing protein [Colletotrichum karsti]
MAQYESKEQILALGETDPQLAALLSQPGGDDVVAMMNSIHLSMVAHAEAARQPLPGTKDTDHEYDIKIPMRGGFENPARIFKPDVPVPGRATVVMIHGGGFTIGHPTHVGHYARGVAKLFGTTVISITHRLTPEFKFPIPSNDIWDSLEWIFSADDSTTAALGGYNKASFIIGGVSAGGNLSAVTAQKWVSAKKTPNLVGIWLNIPWILEAEVLPEKYAHLWLAREQNTNSLVINGETLRVTKATYQPDFSSPDFSPFNDENAHKGLPPVYFQVCGQDPLRDDAIIYEKVLKDHGVSTKIDVYAGVPHGFADLLPTFGLAQKFLADSMKGFAWLFGESAPSDAEIVKALTVA